MIYLSPRCAFDAARGHIVIEDEGQRVHVDPETLANALLRPAGDLTVIARRRLLDKQEEVTVRLVGTLGSLDESYLLMSCLACLDGRDVLGPRCEVCGAPGK